jgi:hypothetical protein
MNEASERSLKWKDLGQLRAAKPVPVPNLRIHSCAFLADNGGEIRPLSAGVTPAEAGTGS